MRIPNMKNNKFFKEIKVSNGNTKNKLLNNSEVRFSLLYKDKKNKTYKKCTKQFILLFIAF